MILGLFGINPASWVTSFVTAMFKDALGAIGTAAADVLGALLGFMNATTEPVFSAGWWTSSGEQVFVRVLAVAGGLMFLGFAMSVVSAVLSHDQSVMAKAVLHVPLAVIEMAALVTVTAALVSASDELSTYIAGGGGKGLSAFVTGTLAVAVAAGGIVGMLLAGFIIVAGLLVWAVLIVRTALIYVAVMAGPLIFASAIHPATRHVRKRYVEGGIALIGSKVIMAIAFATGSAMLGGLTSSPSFSAAIGALMQALAILLIAAFAPFIFIKLLIAAEALTIAEGVERRPLRATMSGASGIYHAAGLKHMMGRLGGGSGGESSGGEDGSDPDGGSGGGSGGSSGGGKPQSAWRRTNVARAAAAARRATTKAAAGMGSRASKASESTDPPTPTGARKSAGASTATAAPADEDAPINTAAGATASRDSHRQDAPNRSAATRTRLSAPARSARTGDAIAVDTAAAESAASTRAPASRAMERSAGSPSGAPMPTARHEAASATDQSPTTTGSRALHAHAGPHSGAGSAPNGPQEPQRSAAAAPSPTPPDRAGPSVPAGGQQDANSDANDGAHRAPRPTSRPAPPRTPIPSPGRPSEESADRPLPAARSMRPVMGGPPPSPAPHEGEL